jgi:hypothetical protein
MSLRRAGLVVTGILSIWAGSVRAQEKEDVALKEHTIRAFNRYVQVADGRATPAYLWVDGLEETRRTAALRELRAGGFLIESVTVRDGSKEIDIPDGRVHHWLGTVFVNGVRLDEAVRLLQDYDRHSTIYSKNVKASKLRSRNGDRFDFYMRFEMTKFITVTTNTEHRAQFTKDGPDRVSSRINSTRIAEVVNAGEPGEREKPVGDDSGFLWRLNSYWKFLERDGGVYIQCESISLTRGIPWYATIVRPLITGIPRESLTYTLETTRDVLAKRKPSAPMPKPASAR